MWKMYNPVMFTLRSIQDPNRLETVSSNTHHTEFLRIESAFLRIVAEGFLIIALILCIPPEVLFPFFCGWGER